MTEVQQVGADAPDDSAPPATVYSFVAARVLELQRGALKRNPREVGALARLRRALNVAVANDPTVWAAIYEGFPERFQYGDTPTPEEEATKTALCLYATHQQSQGTGMHRSGVGVGDAMRRLAYPPGADAPGPSIIRRFNALVTADHPDEITFHLRSIVGLLRAQGIPLDYARLAQNLTDLRRGRRDRVLLRWSREFSRQSTKTQAGTEESSEGGADTSPPAA